MDTFWTIARVVVSLAVVLALVWALGRAARRRTLAGGAQVDVAVVGRAALSRSASVAVVRVGGRAMVLGVTDTSVSLLGALDPAELDDPAAPAPVRAAPSARTGPTGPTGRAFEQVMAAVDAHPAGPRPAALHQPSSGAQPLTRAELRARSAAPAAPASSSTSPASSSTSALAGSALSPATWSRAVGALRERSARR